MKKKQSSMKAIVNGSHFYAEGDEAEVMQKFRTWLEKAFSNATTVVASKGTKTK